MKYVLRFSSLLLITSVLVLSLAGSAKADAFNQNRIMDDAVFSNASSMSAPEIDNWLNVHFPSSCISTSNGFSAPDPIGYNSSQGFLYGGNVSGGQVIYDAAQAYGINPQVLLATLQKESSVVSGDASYHCAYMNTAMGYGCPDSGSCPTNPATMSGFSKQVIHAAWLFKFGQQRSEGNTGWAVIKGGWNNSDDPPTCYGGPMTQGTLSRGCGQAAAYYDGYTTIDGTAVHMDDGATAALYWYTPHFSGNQHFFSIFTSWFGPATISTAFKSPSSAAVYLNVNGYKVAVPSMGMLQDFGISPNSIQTIGQSEVDGMPVPSVAANGISPTLSYLVKSSSDSDADGGSLYLVSIDRKYHVTDLGQLSDFGFSTSAISYLPLNTIQSIPGSSYLSNYISTPQQAAFQVGSGQKRIIFDYPTYIQLNPSNNATPVSYYTADLIASGNPIANRDIAIKYQGSDTVYLYLNNTYYTIATHNAYQCWGFDSTLKTPLYTLVNNNYIAPITSAASLSSCTFNDGGGNTTLLSRNTRYTVPSSYGITSTQAPNQDIIDLADKLPSGGQLKSYINDPQTSAVWYMGGGGAKTVVPTYSNFVLLGINSSNLSPVDDSAVPSIPTSSDVKLGSGQVVKTQNSSQVYVISGNSRILYSTSDNFLAYGNKWGDIETYPQATLDRDYPYGSTVVNRYFYDQPSDSLYLVDPNGCYKLNSSLQTSYAQSQNNIASSQTYTSAIFPHLNLGACKNGSVYVKQPGDMTVYWVDNGTKHPVSDWDKMVQLSGTSNPYIINLSAGTLQTLTTGPMAQ